MGQLREWHLHLGQDLFQLPTRKVHEADFTYAITLAKGCNDVVRARCWVHVALNYEGQDWPDVQCIFCGCFESIIKSEIQATW